MGFHGDITVSDPMEEPDVVGPCCLVGGWVILGDILRK